MNEANSNLPAADDGDDAGRPGPGAAMVRKRIRRWFRRIIEGVVVFYVLWCLTLLVFQGWLIFPADMAPAPMPRPPEGAVVMKLDRPDGVQVEGWFIPAPGSNAHSPAPAVMFFHGNAELIDFQDDLVRGYHRLGWSVLLPEYRGYGRSGGKPSQDAIRADMVQFFDALAFRPDVDRSRIALHGRSIGGAVAADLARQRRPTYMILESTFTSLPAMATSMFLIPGFICRQPFRTDEVLANLAAPLLIFHGRNDWVVPVSHGRRLRELSRSARLVEFECGHNDLPPGDQESVYWNEIAALLSGRPQCLCSQTKLTGGWCIPCRVGYLAGVRIESVDLFEALDAHGHELDGNLLECASCRGLIKEGGFCDSCRLGFVHGLAYFSRLTFALAKGEPREVSSLTCAVCKRNTERHGWCDACAVGMVGGLAYKMRADYEDATRYGGILAEVVSKPVICDSCVLAAIADETCPYCGTIYRAGKPVTKPTQ